MKLAKVFSTVIAACTIAIAPPAQATESANCGVQVVVETHSDQILNGIRLAVHGEKIEPEDVQLHYFQRQENQGQTFIKVVSPRIDKNGRIDRWSDGFFDEWENILMVLLEPAKP
ncbi:DUF3696 domain-containing protein [Oscillatoria laete-virens NRMC-F 0139]|nr:DUF3696 domain-containing protein [Oscillatoria laete-virens]MDI9634362.1 DUF3696 domain-containing protein [Geitlerinema splendidum]MDL5055386.1 DUF3696 domain-containing protein [Oscillatoria laete-virens NRMC-F 0139]